MLVVLSDLHFSEAQSTKIGQLTFNKNLPAEIYQSYLAELNQIAVANQIKKVELVLAGDIFEISRSGIWLEGPHRPYRDNQEITPGSPWEENILKILEAISIENKVKQTLVLFSTVQDQFDVEIELHYLLGNHDRLVNATPETRKKARSVLGLTSGDIPLDHQFIFREKAGKSFCLVRHGQEYDPMNFGLDTHGMKVIPMEFPEDDYGRAPLGDITTVEFGAALPRYFVDQYGQYEVINNPVLMALYERLMAFDDVRPTTALLAYLFSTPSVHKKQTWEYMKPCFKRVINTLADNDQFMRQIESTSSLKKSQRRLLEGILNSELLTNGVPYWMIKQLMKRVSKTIKLKSPMKWAKREALIQDPLTGCKCVISGHTHFPEVSLLSAKKGDERYYINTGTWRNVVPATRDFKEFGRLNANTKVIVFRPHENRTTDGNPDWSFHYMSGFRYGNHRHL
jgi:UDP-2,3-diacylglucosamine pyrophosphatase LpxH